MKAQNNVTHVYVSANTGLATGNAPTTTRGFGSKLLGEEDCGVSALTGGNRFQFLWKDAADNVQVSPVLEWDNLLTKSKVAHSAATSQQVSIGYNGTDAGEIEVTAAGNYLVTIAYNDDLAQFGNKQLYKFAEFNAGASSTQYAIVKGLLDSLNANMTRDVPRPFYGEILNSANAVASSGGAFTVTKGSKTVTVPESSGSAGDAGKYNTDSDDIAVGDLIRFGHATDDHTFGVYRVAAVSGTAALKTITLDTPYTGASGTVNANVTGVIAAADIDDFGLRITANDDDKPWILGRFAVGPLRFDVGLSDAFGDTRVEVLETASKGHGTYEQVAEMEYELIANRMEAYKIAEYPITFSGLGATAGETYTLYTLRFKDNSTETFHGTADSFITVVVASAGATATTALDTLLGF